MIKWVDKDTIEYTVEEALEIMAQKLHAMERKIDKILEILGAHDDRHD